MTFLMSSFSPLLFVHHALKKKNNKVISSSVTKTKAPPKRVRENTVPTTGPYASLQSGIQAYRSSNGAFEWYYCFRHNIDSEGF